MAMFAYQALTADKRLMRGTLEASSLTQARDALAEMKLEVHSLDESRERAARTPVGRAELLLFNQQLASITRASIPLDVGLRQVAAEIDKPSMRKMVEELADDLQAGISIEDAFGRRQKLFPPLYGYIVKAGVQSGRLSEMLTSLNRHLETEGQTRRILFEAMTYPLVVFCMAAILLTGMFTFVFPPLAVVWKDMGSKTPVLTEIFVNLADHVVMFWLIVGGVVAVVLGTLAVLGTTPAGRRAKESLYLSIPLLGRLYHRSLLSRMSDAMALLVGAGCDLPATFRLGAATTGSQVLVTEAERLASALERGENLIAAGASCHRIPSLLFYSMQAGYQRNELQDNLYGLSEMYAQQVRTQQSRLQGLLLPLMLIIVGGVLAVGITAMFLPMAQFINAVQ